MEERNFYHGSSSELKIGFKLLPPSITGNLQEKGRKKNLDKVFFTASKKSALIYAGRAVNVFGGVKVIYRVIPMSEITMINKNKGTEVYACDWAFVEQINDS